MNVKRWGWILFLAAVLQSLSCSSGQRLQTITVMPATVVFGAIDRTLHAQLTATGTYTHPPATKDITDQVTWTSSVEQVAQVNATGLVQPNTDCGVSSVTATLKTDKPRDNVVSGTMSVTVDDFSDPNCPHIQP